MKKSDFSDYEFFMGFNLWPTNRLLDTKCIYSTKRYLVFIDCKINQRSKRKYERAEKDSVAVENYYYFTLFYVEGFTKVYKRMMMRSIYWIITGFISRCKYCYVERMSFRLAKSEDLIHVLRNSLGLFNHA